MPAAVGTFDVLLTLDRGNTSLGVMLHGASPRRWNLPAQDQAGFARLLETLPRQRLRVVASTVVVGGLDAVAATLVARGLRLELAGRELACPLTLAYPQPGTLGTDRWLVALAAHARCGDALVVDCGTAIKVDAVTAAGRFLGGSIAPGLKAMANGLAAAAPRLPAYSSPEDVRVPAVTSQDCVDAGVLLSFCGAVERLVDDVAVALPAGAARLITGGDAATYQRHGRRELLCVPDLLHEGLRCLAERCAPAS